VLVPAHNESSGLVPTIEDIKAQLRPADRLVVIADNCSDDTPAIAAAAGAEVVERNDPERVGKGYALDAGLRHLGDEAPDIVVVVDADCRLHPDAIDRLAATCMRTRRPAQALYLMTAPPSANIRYQVAEFAWCVKNQLRPLGLAALGGPSQLVGTGMAFPYAAIGSVNLASGAIVEDLKLGLDLAAAGHPPVFCPAACVTSQFASTAGGAATQRQRWEGGHVMLILGTAIGLLWRAVVTGNWNLLALTLDLVVPPLSLLAMAVLATTAVAALAVPLGLSSVPLFVSAASLAAFSLATLLAWLQIGRAVLPARAIWRIIPYMFAKLGLYRRIVLGKGGSAWIRTDRSKSRR
jgi:glycosyltransferase involved in cell wall biosynthesis